VSNTGGGGGGSNSPAQGGTGGPGVLVTKEWYNTLSGMWPQQIQYSRSVDGTWP
jgi:hypothetical protein